MLPHRLARGDWQRADINVLADRLARFFATARRVNMQPTLDLGRFRAECRDSRLALLSSGARGLQYPAQYVVRRIEAFIDCRKGLLLRRFDNGRLVEGHCDLRPEHICLGSAPVIIDCLEFRAHPWFLDPVKELAFLTMDAKGWAAAASGGFCSVTIDCAWATARLPC